MTLARYSEESLEKKIATFSRQNKITDIDANIRDYIYFCDDIQKIIYNFKRTYVKYIFGLMFDESFYYPLYQTIQFSIYTGGNTYISSSGPMIYCYTNRYCKDKLKVMQKRKNLMIGLQIAKELPYDVIEIISSYVTNDNLIKITELLTNESYLPKYERDVVDRVDRYG